MYSDLLGGSSPRSEGGITWSAHGARSPLFDSDRPAPSDSSPPVSPNSGEPGMVITRSLELPSAASSSLVAGWLDLADWTGAASDLPLELTYRFLLQAA